MKTTIKLKLRPSTVDGKEGSLYFRLIKNRKVRTVTTPYKIYAEEWNPELSVIRLGGSVPQRERQLQEMAFNIREDTENLKESIRQLEYSRDYNLDEVVNIYLHKGVACQMSVFVDQLKQELIENAQERTAMAYQSVVNKVSVFCNDEGISLDKIDSLFVQQFESYMKKKENQPNTISFYMRNLRAIYNKAIKMKVIDRKKDNPFQDVYTGVYKTRKRAVKKEIFDELMSLNLLEDKDKHLIYARDMFFLSFYLRGISFIDLAHLRKKDMSKEMITYTRRKTGQRLEIALTPEIREIINKYASQCRESEFLLPILTLSSTRKHYSNTLKQQNNRLKMLSRMIGLERYLTTYVSRHSWASIARAKGIPVSVISQGLGHESEKTTLIYLDSFDYSTLHKANQKIINFTKKVPKSA